MAKGKGFRILWIAMTAVYLVWMLGFMRWDTYTMENTLLKKEMYPSPAVYYIWVAVSAIIFLIYPLFIERIYYADKLTAANRVMNIVSLAAGCAYITAYGCILDPLKYTASMTGLEYPWLFKLWCIASGISVFTNTLYMYRKFNFKSTVGVSLACIGCAVLYVTVNIPSAGEDLVMTLQCLAHWSTALLYAFLSAIAILLFLFHKCRSRDGRFIAVTAVYAAILVLMIVLLATVGKSTLIENLPIWATYILLFLMNFTSVFDDKKPENRAGDRLPDRRVSEKV